MMDILYSNEDFTDGNGYMPEQTLLAEEFTHLRSLWASVLFLGLMDYQYGLKRQVALPTDPVVVQGISSGARRRRRERILDWERHFTTSRAWLHSSNETVGSFLWICSVLDVEPKRVRDAAHDPKTFDRMKNYRQDAPATDNEEENDDEAEAAVGHVEHHVGVPTRGEGQGEWEGGAPPDEGRGDGMGEFE